MAEMNPTVVITHLDDDKLRKSIDSLVNYVDEKFKAMTTSTANAVNTMQQSLNKLGEMKITSTGGGESRSAAIKKEKKEVEDLKVSYDQMAQALQKATRYPSEMRMQDQAKSARESYHAFMQGYKAQGEAIARQIQEAEAALNRAVQNRVTDLNAKLDNAKKKLGELYTTLYQEQEKARSAGTLGMPFNAGIARTQQSIEYTKKHIEELNAAIAKVSPNMFTEQVQQIEQLRARREQVLNTMKEETQEQKKQEATIQQTTTAAQQQETTEEQRIAKIKEEWELEQKLHQEQGKRYDAQNEINRQLEIEKLNTAENLAFQEKINAARAAKDAKEGGVSKRVRETNELTGAIASLLGIQEREVAVTNMESASQHRLANYLSQLKNAYQRLDKEGMNTSNGKMLADEIQRVSRAYAEMTKQMNRPTSLKNALGLDENTLDRIAYKIQQLNAYRAGLNITDQKQVGEMRSVETEIDRLKKKQDELMGNNEQVIKSNNALTRSWNYMKNRLAFYFTVGASTQFVKNLIEVRSQYEMNERALGILIDSAERGTQIFNELSQMALVSPYTLIELSTAAKQLSAYDVAAKDLVDTTRRLADISAAVGLPVERLTTALGQIKAFEHLTSMTARRFSSAGIPLIKALADHYTELEGKMVSVADVYDRMKKKAISYNDVMAVITEMTDKGGKFFDFQAKMADTLKVQLANLTLAWNNMLNDIGNSEQGVIVGGIKGLKLLFLQWENISKAFRNLAWILGIVKGAQLLYYLSVRKSSQAIALHNILGNKMSRNLKAMAVGFRNTKRSITEASVAMKSFAVSTIAITAMISAVVELGLAFYDAYQGIKSFNSAVRDGAAENAKNISKTLEQYQALRESLYKYEKDNGSGSTIKITQDIDNKEANKAWVSIREEIELSSAASDTYISRLMQIENVSERLRQGFVLLEDLKAVNAALAEIGDHTIFLQQDWSSWWNLWLAPDSFKENLEDFQKAKKNIDEAYGDIETAREKMSKASSVGDKNLRSAVTSYDKALEIFRSNLNETTKSVIDFISLKGWSGDENKINEVFAQITNKVSQELGLSPDQAFLLQLEVEEARSKAAKKILYVRLADEKAAFKAAIDEEQKMAIRSRITQLQDEIKEFDKNNGRGRVLWENYTKWMKEQHMSQMTQMFRGMTAEQIQSINFQEKKWDSFAKETAKQFSEEHNLSFTDTFTLLKNWVLNANKWSIFIPLTIGTDENKSVYDTLTEADKAADEAWSKIQRLNTRKNELLKKGASAVGTSEIDTEYANTLKEITDAQDDYNKALAKGGHSKKEDRANTKNQKQAETELQKVIKEEVSLINKARSAYKNLTKEGVDSTKALTIATSGYEKSIRKINDILGKNGLRQLDLSKYVGIENPRPILDFLNSQLSSGRLNRQETETIEGVIRDLNIDVVSFDQKTLISSLNNELSKIKDEYELAVELDANPELGDMFTEMFGVDTTNFPKTIDEYMQRVQDEFDKGREKFNYQTPLNVFKATENDWIRWGASVGIVTAKLDEQGNIMANDTTALDKFKAKFVEAQGVAKKWATDIINNTKKLEYDLAELNDKIAIKEKEQVRLKEQIEKEKNEITKHYLELTYQNNEKAIDELRSQALSLMPEYARVFNSIAEHSAGVARRLQKDLMKVFDVATFDSASNKWTLTSSNGQKTILNDTQYRKEREKLTKEMRKSQSTFQKIKEAFNPSEKDGVVDYAKGIELIAEEAKKAADGLRTVADIVTTLGRDDESAETLNDIATTMEGVATAAQGYAKIQSGDIIGGATDMVKGTWQAVSTWLDNGDKKISKEIEKSERQVRKLELAYIDLEHAIEEAYGTETIGAQKAAIANKELQLAELKRQLTLEQSRKKKHQDQDRIIELQKQIKELEYDIKKMTKEIVNDLLGISSIGSFAEDLVSSMISAFKNGEDYMLTFEESFDKMIDNIIMKSIVSRVVAQYLDAAWADIDKLIKARTESIAEEQAKFEKQRPKDRKEMVKAMRKAYEPSQDEIDAMRKDWESNMSGKGYISSTPTDDYFKALIKSQKKFTEQEIESYANGLTERSKQLEAELKKASVMSDGDIHWIMSEFEDAKDSIFAPLVDELKKWYTFGESASEDKLSALQQGIQGITEDTAGALEGYMNGVSQQVYLQSDLLTQIRDAVVMIDSDTQMGVQAQMLLQLQQTYAVQMAIQNILQGWSNPSGMAMRVEMVN